MNRLRTIARTVAAALGLALSAGGTALASFEDGVRAYEAGAYDDAREAWAEAAASGDARSQWNLGNLYLSGKGLDKPDSEAAAGFYLDAARQGFAEAQVSLATLYRLGEGVPRDLRKATDWLYAAALQGHPLAMTDLGDIFLSGVEDWVNPSPGHAHDWYRLAALQQVAIAQVKLGQIYFYGLGVQEDRPMGYAWITAAADLAKGDVEPAWSKRVMPLDRLVDAGEEDGSQKPLREVILELQREIDGELTEEERRDGGRVLARLDLVPILPGGGFALGDRGQALSVQDPNAQAPQLRPVPEDARPAPVGEEVFVQPLKAPGTR